MTADTLSNKRTTRHGARLLGAVLGCALLLSIGAMAQSPARVNIGTAGDFIALAKSGISATGTTQITGNIGVSPVAATAITGFGLIMDPSGTFSTSSLVTGKVYAANYTSPTPSKMTTAISDMETAYTDAAGRATPNYTELYSGDLTGKTLTPGLYKWSTGVLISSGGVTLSGGPSDVWIFQIAGNVTLASGAIVSLTGGAQSANIFWQVAGQVTLGTTSAMKGIVLCQTAIVMSTGASLDGRALAQTAVTMDGNTSTITIPSDTTRPTVLSTDPANNAIAVATNKQVTATFSETMRASTINGTTFTVRLGAVPVTGVVTYSGTTATFTHPGTFAYNSTYTATVTNGVMDTSGNSMLANYTWTFTTRTAPDSIRPTVVSTDPANGSLAVAKNKVVSATFSEVMRASTINGTTFMLKAGTTPVAGTVTYAGSTASFTPTSYLLYSTLYTATITNAVADTAGNTMLVHYVWTFTTLAAPDTIRPFVISVDPPNGATDIAINSKVAALFSETMDPTTLNAGTFTLMNGALSVPGVVTIVGNKAVFAPTGILLPNTLYSALITTGVKDLAGNAMLAPYPWRFRTGSAPDTIRPTVTYTDPENAAIDVAINKKVSATFSEVMDPTTITGTTFMVKQGATPVPGVVTYAGITATWTPSGLLLANTIYTATITTAVRDLAGNSMLVPYVWFFNTGAAPDTTHPTVTSTDPANGATKVAINKRIAATFSEVMDPTTLNGTTYTLTLAGIPVPGRVFYGARTATFTPDGVLAPNSVYTATISTGAEDLAGNGLLLPYTWRFTTGAAPDTIAPMVSSTDPANGAVNVGFNKKISAMFTETMDPFSINTSTYLLMQGSTPVQGTVVYSVTTTTFYPAVPLLPNTLYTATITKGVRDLAGNAMLADYTWSFRTGFGPDTTRPFVISTDPMNAETGVSINKRITATFSERMDPLTITTATYILMQNGQPVSGTVSYAAFTAMFTPMDALAQNTLYSATIFSSVKDLAGNMMIRSYSWSFTTGNGPDATAPYVLSTDPANAATGVVVTKELTAIFSESMNPLTINTATFLLRLGGNLVAGSVHGQGANATFIPASGLLPNTLYTATITSGVEDLAGNGMAANYTWSFTTGTAVDRTQPFVISTDPAHAATGVPFNKHITATFSEPMDPLTISAATFTLAQGSTPVSGTVTYNLTTATFVPAVALAANTIYTGTITTGARDLAGNPLRETYTWSFSTAQPADTTRPTVCCTDPARGAIGVLVSTKLTVTFSEIMDPSTLNIATFLLARGATAVAGTVTSDDAVAVFSPTSALLPNTLYTATITTGVKDLAGNAMASAYVWTFTTAAVTDAQTPGVRNDGFMLSQNFPNPFNPSTSIQYRLETADQVTLKVYNMLGHEVATLVNGRQEAGNHTVLFNADDGGRHLPSGMYTYRLTAGTLIALHTMMLNK